MSVTCKSHLTSGVSVHPENTVTHSAGNVHVGEKFVGLSLELLSSKVMALFAYLWHPTTILQHTWCRGFCTLVHSFDQVRGQHLHG